MFGKPKLDMIDIKRYLLDNLREFNYNVGNETDSSVIVQILINSRVIEVRMMLHKNKRLIVDIEDSYFLLRIPRGEFKEINEYRQFIMSFIQKLKQ